MKKLWLGSLLPLFSILAISNANAAIDWTDYLSKLQRNCDTSEINLKKIPKKYQPSIISNETKKKAEKKDDGTKVWFEETDIKLKDATAFGYPIIKISQWDSEQINMSGVKVYFGKVDISNLRHKFYYVDGSIQINSKPTSVGAYVDDNGEQVGYETSKDGYVIKHMGEVSFKIDNVKNIARCDFSI